MERPDDQLAIEGGVPVVPAGPPPWPPTDEKVREALLAAYADGSWGKYHGPHVERLESELVQQHHLEHALACCSGTFAVELALRALQIGPGDEVILAGYDFPGNFRAIESVGARPVLVDIDPHHGSLDPTLLEEACGPKTRAILVSHLHSGMAPMQAIREIADQKNLRLVEDACQAPGAFVDGRLAGTWGDVGVLSFGGSKLLTAGRGGAILTHDAAIAQRARIYCERGNHAYPLSELQAAVLLPQLDQLAVRNETRRRNVAWLLERLNNISCLQPTPPSDNAQPAFYKMSWLYDGGKNASRGSFIAAVQAEGVALDTGFRGFARRPASRCRSVGTLPHSRRAAADTLLLHHPILLASREVLENVATAIEKVAAAKAG